MLEDAQVHLIPNLSDPDAAYDLSLEAIDLPSDIRTMLVLVDGLSTRISDLINEMFTIYGLDFNYIGGGAGSLSFQQKPCLFTNEGLIQDSAVLAMLTSDSGVGVGHGWTDVAGPFHVTQSRRNVIQTLDWKPAFEVYKEVVESHGGGHFTDDNFFDLAKSYPFGIIKLGSEKIVRDPMQKGPDGSLVCVGEVPERSFVHILTGDVESLVGAAGTALKLGTDSLHNDSETRTLILMDCISRVMFLGEQFSRELEAVCPDQSQLIGALTLGEIANSGQDYLEFYNKTSVVGVLVDPCSC